jgi:hypothetical protein
MKYLLILITALTLCSCSSSNKAYHTLSSAGYTNIQTKGWAGPLWCGEEDVFSTKFTATNSNGQVVSGVVCNGFFKGGTIRF